jgi:hypothetical protein
MWSDRNSKRFHLVEWVRYCEWMKAWSNHVSSKRVKIEEEKFVLSSHSGVYCTQLSSA